MTLISSKGGIIIAFCSFAIAFPISSLDSLFLLYFTILAPHSTVPFNFVFGESSGITIVAFRPVNFAAAATACAWLPLDQATTFFTSSGNCRIVFIAPLNLKAPIV